MRDAKTLLFFVVGQGGLAVQSPITAKLTNNGRNLRLQIPEELRRPGGTDASLTGLTQTFKARRARTTSSPARAAKNKKHPVTAC